MNRNAESHFAELPHANIERSRFDRSHSVKFTGNVGQVIPFLCDPVLPGDTWEIDTSKVVRLQTLLSPVMDNAFLDTYYFFVPNRLVWDHWKEFCGENTASAWYPSVQYSIPKITIPTSGVDVGSVLDYLGIPPYNGTINSVKVNALRVRGYSLIMDQWFRDQNLQNPLNLYTGDSDVNYSAASCETGGVPFIACKTHDYFTSCLPGPQKSAQPVNIPASGLIPVVTNPTTSLWSFNDIKYPMIMQYNSTGSSAIRMVTPVEVQDTSSNTANVVASSSTINSSVGFRPMNLVAASDPSSWNSLHVSVNDLRLAFQTQKFLEKQARGGSRYREILLSHFGVHSPDARQQVPEYLGGNRIPLNVSQVVNSAESSGNRLGNVGAYSLTTDVNNDVFKSFTEHGYIYGLMVVRYDHSYSQGAEYDWFVDNLYDLYWPVFACISEQPVRTRELYWPAAGAGTNPVFGYQEAWASYRYKNNRVAGEMRPLVSNGLYSWSFADAYTSQPTLSSSWVEEDKANVDRTLAVSSSVSNQFWSDFYVKPYQQHMLMKHNLDLQHN